MPRLCNNDKEGISAVRSNSGMKALVTLLLRAFPLKAVKHGGPSPENHLQVLRLVDMTSDTIHTLGAKELSFFVDVHKAT